MAKTIIFCALCAEDKAFELVVDANNEVVSSDDKGHTLKFPTPQSAAEFRAWLESHKKENEAPAKKALADNAQKEKVEKILEELGE